MSDPPQPAPPPEIAEGVHCPQCGYNLNKAVSDRCSECGYAIDRLRAAEPGIPFSRTRGLARVPAFFKTIWMVTFRNRRFCEEFARATDVGDYRAARRFQLYVVLLAYVPVPVATMAAFNVVGLPPHSVDFFQRFQQMAATGVDPTKPTMLQLAVAEVWPIVAANVFILVFLFAATGVPSYFFHPRRLPMARQNAAIVMSYYTCGPLALLPVAMLLGLVVYRADAYSPADALAGAITGLATAAILIVVWWSNLVRTVRRIMPEARGRFFAVAGLIPVLWISLAVLILVVLPSIVFGVLIVIDSLQ